MFPLNNVCSIACPVGALLLDAHHKSLQDYWQAVSLTCCGSFWDLIISASNGNTIERGLSAFSLHIYFFSKVDENFIRQ